MGDGFDHSSLITDAPQVGISCQVFLSSQIYSEQTVVYCRNGSLPSFPHKLHLILLHIHTVKSMGTPFPFTLLLSFTGTKASLTSGKSASGCSCLILFVYDVPLIFIILTLHFSLLENVTPTLTPIPPRPVAARLFFVWLVIAFRVHIWIL